MRLTDILIERGNRARSRHDWARARAFYATALRLRPGLSHIWVQLGHMLNEQGQIAAALAAYNRADQLHPEHADTLHQIARMQTQLGESVAALATYARVVKLEPALIDAAHEYATLAASLRPRQVGPREGLPSSIRFIGLGTTGTCNASCLHCPTGKPETESLSPRTAMPMALFKRIVDGIVQLDLPVTDQISFGLFGDGLVDPNVVARAQYLRARLPGVRLSVNTNGAAFSPVRHAPLNETISILALHCESLDPATYDDLMQPLRFERVAPKFDAILATFHGKVHVSVPISRRNFDERETIASWFYDRGALKVQFDPLSSRCAEDRTIFDSLALDPHPIRCAQDALDDLIVDCDGEVLICCQDFQRREAIGNMRTQSLEEVLGSLRRYQIRRMFADGRHEALSTCSRCYGDLRIVEAT